MSTFFFDIFPSVYTPPTLQIPPFINLFHVAYLNILFFFLRAPLPTWSSLYKMEPCLGKCQAKGCSWQTGSRDVLVCAQEERKVLFEQHRQACGGAVTSGEMLPVPMGTTASSGFPNFTFPNTLQLVAARVRQAFLSALQWGLLL